MVNLPAFFHIYLQQIASVWWSISVWWQTWFWCPASPVIWILLKLAFEVANYRTGSMLGSFESTFCGGCLMGFLGRGVGGWGRGGSKQPACLTWEAPCRYYRRHQMGKRKEGAAVCGSYENCSVETGWLQHCNTQHPTTVQCQSHRHSPFLIFSQLHAWNWDN